MSLLTSTTATPAIPAVPDAIAGIGGADAPASAASADTVATLPLFAQLLNLTQEDAAPAANSDAGPAPATDDSAPVAPAADSTAAMASMAATMLAVALPPPASASQPAPADGSAGTPATARIDALTTCAALNGASTRLDLSAAGVAVTAASAPALAASGAAAPSPAGAGPAATSAPAPTPAPATGAPATAGARVPASDDLAASTAGSADAPAPITAQLAAAMTRAPAQPAPLTPLSTRASERGASRATDNPSAATDNAVRSALAGAAKDDGMPAVTRAEPPPATVNGNYAPASPAPAATDGVKLAGTPEQWQQPLREALGERLQLQLQRNDEHAVIRLDPPNMGRVEISIRHTAGALQVNLSANNSEVLRQLNSIGDSVRQDLSQRQFADVAVTVSPAPRGMLAGGDGNGRGQQGQQEQARTPGRALSDDSDAAATFAMSTERE